MCSKFLVQLGDFEMNVWYFRLFRLAEFRDDDANWVKRCSILSTLDLLVVKGIHWQQHALPIISTFLLRVDGDFTRPEILADTWWYRLFAIKITGNALLLSLSLAKREEVLRGFADGRFPAWSHLGNIYNGEVESQDVNIEQGLTTRRRNYVTTRWN